MEGGNLGRGEEEIMVVRLGIIFGVAAGVVMIAVTTPAVGQMTPGLNMPMGDEKQLTDEEKEKKAERERAYKNAIGKIPDQKPSADPWGNVRGAEQKKNSK
jgi:hypothetical protein